jgi:hypothetical protein
MGGFVGISPRRRRDSLHSGFMWSPSMNTHPGFSTTQSSQRRFLPLSAGWQVCLFPPTVEVEQVARITSLLWLMGSGGRAREQKHVV